MQSSLSGQYKCGINYGGDIIYSTATSINVAGMLNLLVGPMNKYVSNRCHKTILIFTKPVHKGRYAFMN